MKYKEILKILEKDYGWETTRYFKKNTHGQKGSLEFQHIPKYYYMLVKDSNNETI